MNGNGIFRTAAFYKDIVANVAGAALCFVGSRLVYLSLSLTTREEVNESKQEIKKKLNKLKRS